MRSTGISPSDLRGPLDVLRPRWTRLHWRPLTMYESRVGATAKLLEVLEDMRNAQRNVRAATPLLVDEKVHYSAVLTAVCSVQRALMAAADTGAVRGVAHL